MDGTDASHPPESEKQADGDDEEDEGGGEWRGRGGWVEMCTALAYRKKYVGYLLQREDETSEVIHLPIFVTFLSISLTAAELF